MNITMDHQLQAGLHHREEMTVRPEDTAARYGSGLVEVFATPAMVAFMEQTALRAVNPLLPEGYTTVGTEICVRHTKASPVGTRLECTAVLERVEGKKLFFRVEAGDGESLIGSGTHTRYIVHAEEFFRGLKAPVPGR